MDTRSRTVPVVVIVGETASGKSALALELAERFGGEIICADALTVRRGVDIGTAKPSPEDRRRVPHHLIDVAEPCEDFTAAVFKDQALAAIQDISSRGKLPFLVGGTGLYTDAVLYDYGFLPAGDREAREVLNQMSLEELLEQAEERELDTMRIDTRNKRRVIRLLETNGQVAKRSDLRPNTLILGVLIPREQLVDNITKRTDAMFAAGLETEVRRLAETNGWDCEALKGIGYREWREYFASTQTLDETRQRIIKSTLDLAKRQRTWFKRNNSIQWVANSGESVALVTTLLSKKLG
jgi:tRNA dimethylallyltransferase